MPLRFRLEDLSPSQQEQVQRQLSPRPNRYRPTAQPKTQPQNQAQPQAASQPKPLSEDDFNVSDLPTPSSVSAPQQQNLRQDQMSSTEKAYLRDVLHGNGWFEPITLRSPSGSKYTPDFGFFADGVFTLAETKGSYRLGSEGRAHTAFLEAASNFSQLFQFVWVKRLKGGKWEQKIFVPKRPSPLPVASIP